jgi:hypothetical protein
VCGYSNSVSTIGCWIIAGVVAVYVPTIMVANVPETRTVIVRVVVDWRDYGNCAGYSDVSCCKSITKVGGIQKIWTPLLKSQPLVSGILTKKTRCLINMLKHRVLKDATTVLHILILTVFTYL